MPTESDDRDVNEGDDTEEAGGSSKKQNAHMENSEKANAVFERLIERMKTEGIPNPLSCFNEPMKNLSMLDIANIYSDRKRRFSDASKLEEKEANVEAV
jgi:hypothetical protein